MEAAQLHGDGTAIHLVLLVKFQMRGLKPIEAISFSEKEQSKRSDEGHRRCKHEDRRIRDAVYEAPGEQGEEQPAQTAGDSAQSSRASHCALREEIGNCAVHVCREEVMPEDRDADNQQ